MKIVKLQAIIVDKLGTEIHFNCNIDKAWDILPGGRVVLKSKVYAKRKAFFPGIHNPDTVLRMLNRAPINRGFVLDTTSYHIVTSKYTWRKRYKSKKPLLIKKPTGAKEIRTRFNFSDLGNSTSVQDIRPTLDFDAVSSKILVPHLK